MKKEAIFFGIGAIIATVAFAVTPDYWVPAARVVAMVIGPLIAGVLVGTALYRLSQK